MEENRNTDYSGEQTGAENISAPEGFSPNNMTGPAAQQGTAPHTVPVVNNEQSQNQNGEIPPFEGAVKMLGADGKYYWVLQNSVLQPAEPTATPPQVQTVIKTVVIPEGYTENTYRERKEIRRQALSLGFAFLSISFVPQILYYFFFFVLSVLVGSLNASEIMSGEVYGEVAQILFSIIAFTVPFIVFSKAVGKQTLSEITGFKRPIEGLGIPMFCIGIAFCGFAQFASDLSGSFFSQFFNYNVDFGERPDGVFGIIFGIISTAITPALVEEFACRGIVLGSLRKYGDGIAVIGSSVLFAAMHGNFEQIPFAFLVGIVLGYIRIKTDSIWICCAVHGFNNLLSVIYETLSKTVLSNEQTGVFYTIVVIVTILIGFVAMLKIGGKKELFKFEKSTLEATGKQKFKWFFTSPVIIIFLAESFLQSLVYFIPDGIIKMF